MADLLIVLRRDPQTGKQNIVVKLDSDPDALPIEHEQLHRKVVEKLLGAGMSAEDLGDIHIEREGAAVPTAEEPVQSPQDERRAEERGH